MIQNQLSPWTLFHSLSSRTCKRKNPQTFPLLLFDTWSKRIIVCNKNLPYGNNTVSIMQNVDWIWYQTFGLMKIPWSRVKNGAKEAARIAETLHFQRKKRWWGQATKSQFGFETRTAKTVNRNIYQDLHYWGTQKKARHWYCGHLLYFLNCSF